MSNHFRWQVPGNGNPFDCKLEDWNNKKMSQRSIGVLKYINEKGSVSKQIFESDIKDYLYKLYEHKNNDSTPAHFYRPLEFIGLIRNFNNQLSLSIDGKNFLNSILHRQYSSALDFYILQMIKTKYPNTATKDIHLNLFPFRIIFKLLLKYNRLPLLDFLYKIPYIKDINDIVNYDTLKNNNKYEKWNTWVLSYLVKWDILATDGTYIFITSTKKDYIASLLENIAFEDMFFSEEQSYNKTYYTKKIPRNQKLVTAVLKKYKNKCFFDENHITFPTKTHHNFVECHHIIPLSLSDSFSENLDCVNNLIPLCPNCHKAIHLANNSFKEPLVNKIYNDSELTVSFTNITLDDLKEIYIL